MTNNRLMIGMLQMKTIKHKMNKLMTILTFITGFKHTMQTHNLINRYLINLRMVFSLIQIKIVRRYRILSEIYQKMQVYLRMQMWEKVNLMLVYLLIQIYLLFRINLRRKREQVFQLNTGLYAHHLTI